MLILGIESSCDETSVAVVEDGRKILSNVVASQVALHREYGGVVPEAASRRHLEDIGGVYLRALRDAGIEPRELSAVCVTNRPGLIGALFTGLMFAKGTALSLGLPLVCVNHVKGHIAAAYLSNPGLKPPFLALTVSGGHSHIVNVRDYTDMEILGATCDDAAGEAMDKAARKLGLEYPGGALLEKLSAGGDSTAYRFTKPHISSGRFDFSFSGLKTAAVQYVDKEKLTCASRNATDFAASFIAAVTDQLVEKLREAALETGADSLVLCGGVAANRTLRGKVAGLAGELSLPVYMPDLALCGDNAAMIGSQGYYEFLAASMTASDSKVNFLSLDAFPNSDI